MLKPVDDARHVSRAVSIPVVAVVAEHRDHGAEMARLLRAGNASLAAQAQELVPIGQGELSGFVEQHSPPRVGTATAVAHAQSLPDRLSHCFLLRRHTWWHFARSVSAQRA